jgi:pyruvate,water dikinase
VEETSDLLARRERCKHAMLLIGGELRRVHVELGARMARAGRIPTPTDVDHLSERELTGSVELPSSAELARRKRWLAQQAHDPLPIRFIGVPPHGRSAPASGDVLHGWAASNGRYTGNARVIDQPDAQKLVEGEVLVARTTDASWAPVFLRAGAIIVEEGGPLSHAAIVARELGIPAVVNVPGIVVRLESSDAKVSVDGDTGTVVIHDGDGR